MPIVEMHETVIHWLALHSAYILGKLDMGLNSAVGVWGMNRSHDCAIGRVDEALGLKVLCSEGWENGLS